ncbi:MAG TPA: hypothetical protein VJX67_01155 [Blastocatellia bacterium]|nr:hypothetical protein [Blastocatellia bacterium]
MKNKLLSLCLLLSMLVVLAPIAALAQGREGSLVKRGKNGVQVGGTEVSLFDGPGILNYSYHHRWMPGAAGATTVIGIGAGGGALAGAAIAKKDKRKKGAIIGAIAGGGAATVLWLYKNRTERRAIF